MHTKGICVLQVIDIPMKHPKLITKIKTLIFLYYKLFEIVCLNMRKIHFPLKYVQICIRLLYVEEK